MSPTKVRVLAAACVILPALAPLARGQAAPPAPGVTMPAWIKAIEEANTVAEAAKAYSSAQLVNRNDADLHRTYLKRELGTVTYFGGVPLAS